jgi:hypothetical protein
LRLAPWYFAAGSAIAADSPAAAFAVSFAGATVLALPSSAAARVQNLMLHVLSQVAATVLCLD